MNSKFPTLTDIVTAHENNRKKWGKAICLYRVKFSLSVNECCAKLGLTLAELADLAPRPMPYRKNFDRGLNNISRLTNISVVTLFHLLRDTGLDKGLPDQEPDETSQALFKE